MHCTLSEIRDLMQGEILAISFRDLLRVKNPLLDVATLERERLKLSSWNLSNALVPMLSQNPSKEEVDLLHTIKEIRARPLNIHHASKFLSKNVKKGFIGSIKTWINRVILSRPTLVLEPGQIAEIPLDIEIRNTSSGTGLTFDIEVEGKDYVTLGLVRDNETLFPARSLNKVAVFNNGDKRLVLFDSEFSFTLRLRKYY